MGGTALRFEQEHETAVNLVAVRARAQGERRCSCSNQKLSTWTFTFPRFGPCLGSAPEAAELQAETMISQHDRTVLRDLATEYRELCDSERNQQTIARWRNLNNLKSDRPLVYCNTGLLGGEIRPHLPESRAEDRELGRVEGWLLSQLWHAGLGDDRVFYPWFQVRAEMFCHQDGVWGIALDRVRDEHSRGWRNMPVLKKMEDLDRLNPTEHRVIDPDPPLAG